MLVSVLFLYICNSSVLFFVGRFDLSDKDKFFDSKTRSSIVSINFYRWMVDGLMALIPVSKGIIVWLMIVKSSYFQHLTNDFDGVIDFSLGFLSIGWDCTVEAVVGLFSVF